MSSLSKPDPICHPKVNRALYVILSPLFVILSAAKDLWDTGDSPRCPRGPTRCFYSFLERASERAIRSSLKMVVNSLFLLIQRSRFMIAWVSEPR